jgi:hypothetical protein
MSSLVRPLWFVASLATFGLNAACGDSAGSGGSGGDGGSGGEGGSGGGQAQSLGINEVSVLFPLPEQPDSTAVLRLSSEALGGPLLSEERFANIPVFADPSDQTGYDNWIIVAARIDPCFPALELMSTDPAKCRRQIRLIAQPITVETVVNETRARDHGIHLLFDLSEAEFAAALADWRALGAANAAASDAPLGVNPTMVEQGLEGEFATAFRALLVEHVGPDRLSQLTFMQGRGVAWEFGGFMVEGGAFTPIQIHGIDPNAEGEGLAQTFGTLSSSAPFNVTPPSLESDGLMALSGEIDGKFGPLVLTASDAEIDQALQLSLDVEHPAKFNPDTLDCATCHFAGRARERAATLGHPSDGMARYENEAFNLELAIEPIDRESPTSQRAFGWLDRRPVFNHRVVNESAAIAEALNAL